MDKQSVETYGLKHFLRNNQISNLVMESNEEIISRLKFIGYIQKDEKIDTRSVTRQPNHWGTTVYRSFISPEDRNKTLKFLREVIGRSFEILHQYVEKNVYNEANSVLCDLKNSCNGLANLKHTYAQDTKFCCDIDVMLQRINSKIIELDLETDTDKKDTGNPFN